ncbi:MULTISPECIES: sensor histidine kinase [unclassified Clostridioides]|uniref:sensor histidine kinase n=2 Tax=Clostridioides TaxID=1870884 RepID=UPI001D0F9A6F|nr:HAMP domain-containing histidine kinase [Clostridioides sp. ZZV15-6388]MCC0643266.1 HAMP domain-containing histidine kinase [Clostridioides sp. ZZV14-6150]MCC0658903.1 HAMP domain-containing histidine kinase [Clostridioides sp. ZZV14-6154]MCC0664529.1 HAMP domain-containing histidine kinase [Clostridioides sp. ZZV15-6597]MCC0667754.1 HAMP domain-containing histidine kinase [Clostridioides sp. ZZV14-6153]MCC0718986.1 HAMP domain-containing histidine kinase [Clostridioides sp. ZZV14-6105]MCC
MLVLFFAICMIIISIITIKKSQNTCDELSLMLNQLLEGKEVSYPDTKDTRVSKISYQVKKVKDMIEIEVEQSKSEKEAIKSLISNMSHQLKTPLSNITIYCELLENMNLPTSKKVEFLQKMKNQTFKIDWLLESLFKMTKLEDGVIRFETEELMIKDTIVQSISTVFNKAESKNIKINLETFSDIKLFHNKKWTIEAIVNVLENAIKYSPSDSIITISVEKMELYTKIIIKDEGIGIDSKELNNIFKRFYRSKNVENQNGTGIGLYLTRLILEKENGNIIVESKLGRGSCFSIFLQNCKSLN